MSGYVADASAILSWAFAEEQPKNAEALLLQLVREGIAAPPHWSFEVSNIVWVAERTKRLTDADARAFIDLVNGLGVEIDLESLDKAMRETRALAHQYNLTVYDAAYLELAIRRGGTLVSKDKSLLKAAKAAGVKTIAV